MLIKINSNGTLKVKVSAWRPLRVVVEERGLENFIKRLREKGSVVSTMYVNTYDQNGEKFIPVYFRGFDELGNPVLEEIRDTEKCKGFSFLTENDILKLLAWKRSKCLTQEEKIRFDKTAKRLIEILQFVKSVKKTGRLKIGAGVG